MIQFISEFKLPKEFSKKKKFDILLGQFVPANCWKDPNTEIKWDINIDSQKVYLTIDGCAKATIEHALNSGIDEKAIKDGYIAISGFTYPTTSLNEIPLYRDPLYNTPVDCEWNPEEVSFMFTFKDTKWEEINISTLKIDSLETTTNDNGFIKILSVNMYPVVDMTKM